MKSDLELFRTRWLRWLGCKTRIDKPHWVTLLDSDWAGWASSTLTRHANIEQPPFWKSATRERVKEYWRMAIQIADMNDLRKLDELFCDEQFQKQFKR